MWLEWAVVPLRLLARFHSAPFYLFGLLKPAIFEANINSGRVDMPSLNNHKYRGQN